MGSPLTGQLGLPGSQLGLLQLGGPAIAHSFAKSKPTTAQPMVGHVYQTDQVTFVQSTGPLLTRPTLHWQSNGSYDAITLDLPAQAGTGARIGSAIIGTSQIGATSIAQGNVVRLTEEHGDKSILYSGIVESLPDVASSTQTSHQIALKPLAFEADDCAVQLVYTTPTDVAQMVRDAVAFTAHLSYDQYSIPVSTGILYPPAGGGAIDFSNRKVSEVFNTARSMAGPNWYWFVDTVGKVWFQPMGSVAGYSLKLGVDYERRTSNGGSIENLRNDVPVIGGVPAGGSAAAFARYTGTSIGLPLNYGRRTLDPPIPLPQITDQATLQAVANNIGAILDRIWLRVEFKLLGSYAQRINMAQPGGAMLRYFEPSVNPMQETGSGSGAFIGPYVAQECMDDGLAQVVVTGDVPVTDQTDLGYMAQASLSRLLTNTLLYTPAALNVQGVVTGSGGLATAPNPPAGTPSPKRWALDMTSFRAYDGTSANYGAPSGAGVAVEITADGRLFLGGAAANLVIDDVNGIPRVELGPMPARGISQAQTGLRINGPDGVPLVDTFGLIGVSNLLGSQLNFSASLVTGTGAYQTVSGSSVSFTLSRPATILVLASELLVDPTVGDTGFLLSSSVLVDGAQSAANGPICYNLSGAGTTMTPFAIIPSMSATSHTVALGVNQTSGKLWSVSSGYLYVLQFGG